MELLKEILFKLFLAFVLACFIIIVINVVSAFAQMILFSVKLFLILFAIIFIIIFFADFDFNEGK